MCGFLVFPRTAGALDLGRRQQPSGLFFVKGARVSPSFFGKFSSSASDFPRPRASPYALRAAQDGSIRDVSHRHPPAMSRIAQNLAKLAEHMIQLMSRARRLGREITPIVGGDRAMQRHSP
jgi:hypothetical protein